VTDVALVVAQVMVLVWPPLTAVGLAEKVVIFGVTVVGVGVGVGVGAGLLLLLQAERIANRVRLRTVRI
jgi:hypothetical protein